MNPSEKVPVYFANFVLMDYGFGAVFGCPAHDQRDFDFAKKYNLEIKTVVKPNNEKENFEVKKKAYTGEGIIINSDFLNGLKAPEESIIKTIKCFTTRPDTLFGFSFLAVSVDHPISKHFLKDPEFIKFQKECSKTGTTEESIALGEKIGFKTN